MNRRILLLLLILVSVCAMSHVSAADNSDYLAVDNSSDIEMQIMDEAISDDVSFEALKVDENSADEEIGAKAIDYRNIQSIIDGSEEGDTVYLNGTYICDYLVNINKTVNIIGRDDGAVIKLSDEYKEYNTPFFNVNAPNVRMTNVKFVGGLFLFGGALTWQGDNGEIKNCEFTDNIASSEENGIGGAILLYGQNCLMENCVFKNNHAYQHGGAVLWYGDNGRIRDCVFQDNRASGNKGWGGALMLYADDCIVNNCTFINNTCTDYGGAIAIHNMTNKIVNCHFEGNTVLNNVTYKDGKSEVQGGAAVFSTCVGLIIDNCRFFNNRASNALGGALSLSINNTVTRCTFKGNDALLGRDILASSSSTISLNYIVLDFNETKSQSVYGVSADEPKLNNIFEITKINSSVTFSAGMVFKYAQSGTIGVVVEGGILEEKNIRVLNHPEAKINYTNNTLVVSGLDVGEYILRVTTTPDSLHNAVESDLAITVQRSTAAIKASKMTVALNKATLWTIKLIDTETGLPIPKMKVTLKVYTGSKFKTVTLTTNSNGEATYQTKSLAKGSHKVIVNAAHTGYSFKAVTSSISVIKPTALKFKVKAVHAKDGSTLSITVTNKATKKPVNGIKVKLKVYTGKTFKTITLKTKTNKGYKGVCGYGTNTLSVGTHKVVISPVEIKYSGSANSKMVIKSSAKKRPSWTHKIG
ncbi:hypothetical protein [uncultured Methanobrevibacter sp.]|uniref:hypothetical protein n=1 Tax=uncultured Methanobrevibacter sp. TaxID=253161 RepID=UPI00262ECE6B|nr:hypothetical protein [uncultured Methanobrevibacter sp.]